jgi:putative transcriptional regulator
LVLFHLDDQAPQAGRLLIASPRLADPNFERTVILLIAIHDDGALGLVLNRPSPMTVDDPLPQWAHLAAEPAVLFVGGPVQRQAVIALARHDATGAMPAGPDAGPGETQPLRPVTPGVATIDLESDPSEMMSRVGQVRLFSGYAGWSSGQLDAEMDSGAWWVVDAEADDCFTAAPERLWDRVLLRQRPPLCYAAFYPDDPRHQ